MELVLSKVTYTISAYILSVGEQLETGVVDGVGVRGSLLYNDIDTLSSDES